MEDLKAYIESGILELYVLGDLTESERLEVELMLEKHPELRAELLEIEKALEKYAEAHSQNPPDQMRAQILNILDTRDRQDESIVVPIDTYSNKNTFYKFAFAASVALLLLSLIVLINLYSQLKESNNQIAVLRQSNQKFSNHISYVEDQLKVANKSLQIFHNPDEYKIVKLKGTPNAPTASLMIAFNPENEEVMIDMASLKMPTNDTEHQYQLWAMVNGNPVDLGVFDAKGDTSGMIKMRSLKNAQAFAVTLEPKGGSINPTMDQMMVMGAVELLNQETATD
ncbi:anti-sigma factor [Pedobacter sp. P351]|uniref:anti-sigma factor n=1 Tax=Pedobacter superstes TaxID=3133441 RepID=UPI00309FD10A